MKNNKNNKKSNLYHFEKMPYQDQGKKEQAGADSIDFDMDPTEELQLGESDERQKHRTLGEERGASYEP